MVERSFDIGFGSVSVEDIADAKTFDALNTASLLGGLSGNAMIATIAGFKPVKSLIAGDLILSQDNGYVAIKSITKIAATQYDRRAKLVVIGQGTLGPDFPAEDLIVSPEQLILMSDGMNGSDVFVRAGDLVKNRSGVRFLSDIANTYVLDCDGHEAVLVNGHWMGTGYSAQSFTMMTLNAHQARMVGFEFDDVRPLCRAVHIPTADRGQRGSLRIVR